MLPYRWCLCRQKNIELICLYPNSTHIIQPLDIAFFHPFKDIWRQSVIKYKSENNITRLKKEHVASVLQKAFESFPNEKKTIVNGFTAAGLVPLNPNAVQFNVLQKKKAMKRKSEQCESSNSTQEVCGGIISGPVRKLIYIVIYFIIVESLRDAPPGGAKPVARFRAG